MIDRAPDPIAVDQAGGGAGQVAVPHAVGVLDQFVAAGLEGSACVVGAEQDAAGVLGEDREVDPAAGAAGAERIGEARLELGGTFRQQPLLRVRRSRRHIASGFTFQIFSAYSRIVRSLENGPMPATLSAAQRFQACGLAYSSSTFACVAT